MSANGLLVTTPVGLMLKGVVRVKLEYPTFFTVKVFDRGVPTLVVPKSIGIVVPLPIEFPEASATWSLGLVVCTTVATNGTLKLLTAGSLLMTLKLLPVTVVGKVVAVTFDGSKIRLTLGSGPAGTVVS